jgi:AraC family transcriptional regulator
LIARIPQEDEMLDAHRQTLSQPRIVEGRSMRIAGIGREYTFDQMNEIPALWDQFVPQIDRIPGQGGRIAYGVCYKALNPETGFGYLAGIEVAPDADIPADLNEFNIPALRYVVFQHEGHVSRIPETMDAIENDWLPNSGHAFSDTGPQGLLFFERYGEGFDAQTGSGDVEIWLSITRE